jgi:hypothetical protein
MPIRDLWTLKGSSRLPDQIDMIPGPMSGRLAEGRQGRRNAGANEDGLRHSGHWHQQYDREFVRAGVGLLQDGRLLWDDNASVVQPLTSLSGTLDD